MELVTNSAPVPSDYFGVLWALAGIKNALILEHGATGTAFYNAVTFNVMNKQSPKGILFTTGLDEDDAALNIVTRDIGLEAARRLQQRFGTPYYYGLPFGLKASVDFLERITEILDLSLPRGVIASELQRYGHTLSELTSWWHRYENLRAVVCCPYDYAMGLTRFVHEEWGLAVKAVVLPTPAQDPQAEEAFRALGVEHFSVAPGEEKLRDLLDAVKPHILFGSSSDFRLAPQVPIRIHAAMPAFDYLYLFDGTPFVGFRGSLYLTQTLINALNHNPEVWKS